MKTRKFFYLIEANKCIGWQYGTDDQDDADCTKAKLEAWAAASVGRAVVVQDAPLEPGLKARYHVLEGGDLRTMTPAERDALDKAAEDDAAAKLDRREKKAKKIRDGIVAKFTAATYTPLDQDEAKWLTHQLDMSV
jgi:hypothetical protein